MNWSPHATVACIIERDDKLLFVEELSQGKHVFNQPAGHIEQNETIEAAALRETLEETGWRVELNGLVGLYTYTAPSNGVTYYRFCFAGTAIEKVSEQLDPDIISEHWLSRDDLSNMTSEQFRSPLVLKCIEDYDNKALAHLDFIYEHAPQA